jgi:hypothetical protein
MERTAWTDTLRLVLADDLRVERDSSRDDADTLRSAAVVLGNLCVVKCVCVCVCVCEHIITRTLCM